MPKRAQLVLASASPRRRELLAQLGANFKVMPARIDETARDREAPAVYVQRLALAKALACSGSSTSDLVVLAADTGIELDGDILGKPRDKRAGLAMLAALAGREHRVYTSVAIADRGRHAQRLSCTRVRFREMSAAERHTYWASGEPQDKAGAYGIQGRAAAFIEEIHGSYSGVVGLPLFETAELLNAFDIRVP
jgi:septum formation protein